MALTESTPGVKYLLDLRVSEKEIEMYQKILPRMSQLLREANFERKIFADTYFVSHVNQAICFEDLSVGGYQMVTDKKGFDMEQSKMVLTKLAKFHAAAAVMQEQQPDVFRNFHSGMCPFPKSIILKALHCISSIQAC